MPARLVSCHQCRNDGWRGSTSGVQAARPRDALIVSRRRPAQQFVTADDERDRARPQMLLCLADAQPRGSPPVCSEAIAAGGGQEVRILRIKSPPPRALFLLW